MVSALVLLENKSSPSRLILNLGSLMNVAVQRMRDRDSFKFVLQYAPQYSWDSCAISVIDISKTRDSFPGG